MEGNYSYSIFGAMPGRLLAILLLSLLCSCAVTEQNVQGTYRSKLAPRSKLVLKGDKTFEFTKILSRPTVIFGDSSDRNFHTSGNWRFDSKGRVSLTSLPEQVRRTESVLDMENHTSVPSFSFWDQNGDPVSIRFIKYLPGRIKFYLSNCVFISQDEFDRKDTMEFHFLGYPPYKWPHDGAAGTTFDNNHTVILYEETRPEFFKDRVLMARRNKLISEPDHFVLRKME